MSLADLSEEGSARFEVRLEVPSCVVLDEHTAWKMRFGNGRSAATQRTTRNLKETSEGEQEGQEESVSSDN